MLRLYESTGMGDLGQVHWDLVLCLLAAWTIVFLCLIKGIKSSGEVKLLCTCVVESHFPYSVEAKSSYQF